MNAKRERQRELALKVAEEIKNGDIPHLLDVTSSVSYLLNMYHNQKCEPEQHWITEEELKILPQLLKYLGMVIPIIEAQ